MTATRASRPSRCRSRALAALLAGASLIAAAADAPSPVRPRIGLVLGVTREGIRFREGALAGEKLKLFFNQLVRAELGSRSIEDLALPLAIIATDIGTGERVAIRAGELTSAMRASMSVPGLMAPVPREGRKLVDGGLTDNLPVAEARALCQADVLIAVNVAAPLLQPEE